MSKKAKKLELKSDRGKEERRRFRNLNERELGLLIKGLRSFVVMDEVQRQRKLLRELERELSETHGLILKGDD